MISSTDQSMTDTQALAAALAEDAAKHAGEHPELDELADYLAGSLAPETEARIQDHLVACRACTTKLLDLETLFQPDSPNTNGVVDLAKAAGWREQKTRIADLENARGRQRTLRWASVIAASFFVATVGLSVHVSQLQQTIAGLRAPTANVVTAYLDDPTTRSTADAVKVQISDSQRLAVFFLTPPQTPPFDEYEVEVLDAAGTQVLQISRLEPSEDDNLRIAVPLELMPGGDYEVRLDGLNGERREQLQLIPLLLRYE